MKYVNIIVMGLVICFMCQVAWAQENEYINEQEIIEEYEISDVKEGLQSGTKLDGKTFTKIKDCQAYAEIANLRFTNIKLAIQKNNEQYGYVFKIWLALHGVQEDEFGLWMIDGDKAVLKESRN